MEDLDGFVCYDDLAIDEMRARGWAADAVPWTKNDVNWGGYDLVLVRSTWDYFDHLPRFLDRLAEIDRSDAHLENHLDVIRWNVDKRYLRDLEGQGVTILPTLWPERLDAEALDRAFIALGASEIVVKPVVGAGAIATHRLRAEAHRAPVLADYAEGSVAMIQPFAPEITAEGEFSLFYFAGVYSHAILKTPAPGDFRVQEEFGGLLRAIEPEPALRAVADQLPALCPQPPFTLRADFVRWGDGFALMELEAVEPSLYFNLDPASPTRFADAVGAWMGHAKRQSGPPARPE